MAETTLRNAQAVKKQYEMQWITIDGVTMVATQKDEKGYYICIGTEDDPESIKKQIGGKKEGVRIIFEKTGIIEAS